MELQEIRYDKKFMIETAQGNKISKKSTAHGSQNIALGGNVSIFDSICFESSEIETTNS